MENLKDLPIDDLLEEIESRGIATDLLTSTMDVEFQLIRFNEKMPEDKKINLSEDELKDVLDSIDYHAIRKTINEEIYEIIKNL